MPTRDEADFVRAHLPVYTPRIITPQWQSELFVRFLDGYKGLLTHYSRERPFSCQLGECPDKYHKLGTTWKAYAPVLQWRHEDQAYWHMVLEITGNLAQILAGHRLRGEVWQIRRLGKNKRKTMVTGEQLEAPEEKHLPPPFDMIPVLKSAYSQATLPTLGAENPLPPKVTLPAFLGAPPPGMPAPQKEPVMTAAEIEDMRRVRAAAKARLNGNGHV